MRAVGDDMRGEERSLFLGDSRDRTKEGKGREGEGRDRGRVDFDIVKKQEEKAQKRSR